MYGGFYHIDPELVQKQPEKEDFLLRCDTNEVYKRKVYTGNGRTATSYILLNQVKLTEEDVILLPDYLCVSVLNSLEVCKAKFRFFHVNKDLTIDIEDMKRQITPDVKVLYFIHYFGMPQPQEAVDAAKQLAVTNNLVIIEDLTQTLYTMEPGRIGFGDYLIASTRKWMPMTDGGILAVKDGVDCPMVPLKDAYDEAVYKQLLISIFREYYDSHPNKEIDYYLQLEKEANAARYLDFTPRAMTELSRRVFFNMNHQESMEKRRANYMFLYEELKDIPELTLAQGPLDKEGKYVPFGFVLLMEDRDAFYKYLTEHRIIPEIQWILPLDYYDPGEDARYLSDHNVMLQCDQRYDMEDMKTIANIIKEYFRR